MQDHNMSNGKDKTGGEGFDVEKTLMGVLAGRRPQQPVGGNGQHPVDPLDAPPKNLPPPPSPSQLAGAGVEYREDDHGFTLPSITYGTRPELYHLMTELVGDEDRALGHLYRQGRFMVRVDNEGSAVLTADSFAAEVEKHITTQKRGGDKGPVIELFPTPVAKLVTSGPHLCNNLRELAGVTDVPLFRADGSIFSTDGYDPDTKYTLIMGNGITFDVPDEPTDLDVAKAVHTILTPIEGFPFISDADCNAWIGMALTPMLRFIAPGPYKLGLIEAKMAGSGKSFLAEMLSVLHGTGDMIPNMPSEDNELRKLVTSVLQATEGVAVFDNIEGRIASPVLAALLTAKRWTDRLLGKNAKITLPNDRLWLGTGNNVTIDGDIARRVLKCVIDPACPSPELREFAFNPTEWMIEHRSEYLNALGTIIRSWVVSGMQLGESPGSDSYARWRRVINGILDHAGIKGSFDPMENRVILGHSDKEWGTFLEVIHDTFGSEPWRMSELVDALKYEGGGIDPILLPGSLAAKWDPWKTLGFTKSLGRWAMNRDGKYVGLMKIEEAGEDKKRKVKLWKVVKREPEAG